MLCKHTVLVPIAFIDEDEDEVEAREKRSCHFEILTSCFAFIVVTVDRVCRCNHRSARGERANNTGFRNRNSLLLHRLEQS